MAAGVSSALAGAATGRWGWPVAAQALRWVQKDRDIVRAQRFAAVQHAGTFDKIAQFADVAGPRVLHQQCHCRLVKAARRLRPASCAENGGSVPECLRPGSRREPGAQQRQGERTGLRKTCRRQLRSRDLRCVAEMTRTSIGRTSLLPTRTIVLSSSTRSSFTCMSKRISPISSRKSVPPSLASKWPRRRAWAPVKLPFHARIIQIRSGRPG